MRPARILTCLLVLAAARAAADSEPIQADRQYALAAGFYNRELYKFAAEEEL